MSGQRKAWPVASCLAFAEPVIGDPPTSVRMAWTWLPVTHCDSAAFASASAFALSAPPGLRCPSRRMVTQQHTAARVRQRQLSSSLKPTGWGLSRSSAPPGPGSNGAVRRVRRVRSTSRKGGSASVGLRPAVRALTPDHEGKGRGFGYVGLGVQPPLGRRSWVQG